MMRFLNPKVVVSHTSFLALFGITCLFSQACSGQEQMQEQSLLRPPQQVKPIEWIQGPRKVNLGGIAEVNVPEGYQFVDREGAGSILERMGNPVPKNLVGLLASPSGKGGIVLKFSKIGFVKDSDKDRLNAATMMAAIQSVIDRQNIEAAKQGAPLISSAEWQLKPTYDAAENKLEWAIKAQAGKDIAVNYSVRMLGRQGVLEMVAVQPDEPNLDLAPLKRLANGITFLKGQRYADFERGDKVASTTLAALAANDEISDSDSGSAKTQAILFWGGIGAGVLVLGGLATLLVVKKPWRKKGMVSSRMHASRPAASTAAATKLPALQATQMDQKSPVANASAPGTLAVQALQPAHHHNGKTRTGERKRKKRFSFYAFHTDMVMNLTRWNYTGGFGSFTPEYQSQSGVKGSISSLKTHDLHEADSANGFAREISKLIDSQQKLIEGQRRLIEEQNKLIQEKSKLIDAESRVLEKQSELIEEQQLL